MRRDYLIMLMASMVFFSCSEDANTLLPGEKFKIDTTMFRIYRSIDSAIASECNVLKDTVYKKAVDSIYTLRAREIQYIRGDGKPPTENRFPELLEKEEKNKRATE